MKFRLPIELVPQSSHYNNLRKILTAYEWKVLRDKIIPRLDNKCEICGGKSKSRSLDLHEVWDYDKKLGIQKLVRLEGLCSFCHEVKHFYLAKIMGHEKRARKRLNKINGFSEKEGSLYEKLIHMEYCERSLITWQLDISFLETLKKAL